MHNTQPIGIFDSGIGGLSVLREIRELLPNEDLIYIADSAFAPYGNKPLEFIRQRCHDLSQFLLGQNAKAIVIACNTATAAAATTLRQQFSIPIIAMEPGVKPAIAATLTGVVGVLATENTLTSQQFTSLLHRYAANVKVVSQPCPGLVEQIEAGEFTSEQTRRLIEQFTAPLLAAGSDTIVLGCTHYPLIRPQIVEVVGADISIIETGRAVAQQLKNKLQEQQLLAAPLSAGTVRYLTSGNNDHIAAIISRVLAETVSVQVLPEPLANTLAAC